MKSRPGLGALFFSAGCVFTGELDIMAKLWNVALVGATGLVGEQMKELLEERNFPVGAIRFLGRVLEPSWSMGGSRCR
jgi:hypothetical protein